MNARKFVFLSAASLGMMILGASGCSHATHATTKAATVTATASLKPAPLSADGLSCRRIDAALGKIRSTVDILNFGVDEAAKDVGPASPIYAPAKAVDGDLENLVAQDGSTDSSGMSELMQGLKTDEQSLASYCTTAGYTMKTNFNHSISTDN